MYAIITLVHKSVNAVSIVEGKWGDALAAIEQEMASARGGRLKVEVKGTWRKPYCRGAIDHATSFSAYTRGYCEFTFIKKVADGSTAESVWAEYEESHPHTEEVHRQGEDLYDLVSERTGGRCGRRPRTAEEQAEWEHCYEMGDFDY